MKVLCLRVRRELMLIDGKICRERRCYNCCLETEMILTPSDIARICSLGYRLDDFARFDGTYWRLKNRAGRCVFLRDDGLCAIYEHRPLGCRAYPVIEDNGVAVPDFEYCPAAHLMPWEEYVEMARVLQRVFEELGEPVPRILRRSEFEELKRRATR